MQPDEERIRSSPPGAPVNKEAIRILCSYIPYFEKAGKDNVSWPGTVIRREGSSETRYMLYDVEMEQFYCDFCECGLMIETNYVKFMETVDRNKISKFIATAYYDDLRTLLLFYMKGEQFCEGFWRDAMEKKIFLKILQRLQGFLDI